MFWLMIITGHGFSYQQETGEGTDISMYYLQMEQFWKISKHSDR